MNRICHDIWWGRGKPNLSFGIIKKSSKPQESAGVLFRPRASAGRLVDSVQGFTEGEATAPWRHPIYPRIGRPKKMLKLALKRSKSDFFLAGGFFFAM